MKCLDCLIPRDRGAVQFTHLEQMHAVLAIAGALRHGEPSGGLLRPERLGSALDLCGARIPGPSQPDMTPVFAEDQPTTLPGCGSCVHDCMMDDPNPSRKALRPTFEDVPEARRRTMRAILGKDTKPEMLLRRMLHRAGYRFRLHCKALPGRPDLVFPSRRKVIEVRGCWWHRHAGCRYCTTPRTRIDYWLPKFSRNQERDAANERALLALGWDILVIWECELSDGPTGLEKARLFLGEPGLQACPRTGTAAG